MRWAEVTTEEAKKPPTVCTVSQDETVPGGGGGAKVCFVDLLEGGCPRVKPLYLEEPQISGHSLDILSHVSLEHLKWCG